MLFNTIYLLQQKGLGIFVLLKSELEQCVYLSMASKGRSMHKTLQSIHQEHKQLKLGLHTEVTPSQKSS